MKISPRAPTAFFLFVVACSTGVAAGTIKGRIKCGQVCKDVIVYVEGAPSVEADDGPPAAILDQREDVRSSPPGHGEGRRAPAAQLGSVSA